MAAQNGETKYMSRMLGIIMSLIFTLFSGLALYSIQRYSTLLDEVMRKNAEQDQEIMKKAEPCEVRQIFVDEISKWELKLRKEGETLIIIKKR